jgi:hypothetical protein
MDLTGSIVDLGGDGGEIVLIGGDLHSLGKVLTDDTVEVLVATALTARTQRWA